MERKVYKNIINGEWVSSENTIEILSPLDNSYLGSIPAMTKLEIDQALDLAKIGGKKWKEVPLKEKAEMLNNAAKILEQRSEEIAMLLMHEIAKGFNAAQDEVLRTVSLIRYTVEEGLRMQGEIINGNAYEKNSNKIAMVQRVEIGTVLAISPFNYPINLTASKIIPALIAGNSVVLKPPTQGALSALEFVKVLVDSGIPAGVITSVTGRGSEVGDYLIQHPQIDFINFTGSTEVGERIGNVSGVKPLLLELGGKDPAIILPDADLKLAAKEVSKGAFGFSGQRCTAIKRVLLHEEIADEFIGYLQAEVALLTVGTPFENADITPLISVSSVEKAKRLFDDAMSKKAKALTEFKNEDNLMWPVILDFVTEDMDIAWEEPFAPILPILRLSSIEEMIRVTNDSEYGLQAAIFTKNQEHAMEIASKLDVGTVHINTRTQRGPDNFPFLGIKKSGTGVQGIRYSIESMSRIQSIVIKTK
ncbi:succinate-semialdehyde dehydrogenase I [Erysipelotrichaceae bacterium]|nr:succinate-semialdehyde dehydrogenase I [Erysipelotrichaceae bacterium]